MEAYEKEFTALTNQVRVPVLLSFHSCFVESNAIGKQDVTVRRLEERLRQVRAPLRSPRVLPLHCVCPSAHRQRWVGGAAE